MGTILRAAALYFFLLITIRLVGRRAVDHMTPFDMIIIFIVGGMGIQAVVADDRSMVNALLGISTVALMHILVATGKQYSSQVGKVTDSTPVVILGRGEWHERRMKMLRVQREDVMAAARQSGLERLEQVKYAIVERNGSISIIKHDDENDSTEEHDREEEGELVEEQR